jgi:hypothetical protein
MFAGRTTQPTDVRTLILIKGERLGLFGLATFPEATRVVSIGPREKRTAIRNYEKPKATQAVFDDRLQASLRNG